MSPLRVGLFLSFLSSALFAQPTLTISPAVIYQCNANGLGQATLYWQGAPDQVQIRVGMPNGQAMTGLLRGAGFTQTGDWVSDGLRFFLVNGAGQVVAQARASVACGQNPAKPTVHLGPASYLPLAVGNRWIYELNSREVSHAYLTWTVTRKVKTAFREYFEVEVRAGTNVQTRLFREDESGQIYEYVGTTTDASEKPLLDPSLLAKQPYENDLARFPDTVQPVTNTNTDRTKEIFARGVGLIESRTDLVTGPSGGFVRSLKLVEVSIPGGIHLRLLPATPRGISATVESRFVDISGKNAPNCAVPAYAVASPGTDPPGTYKPCMQVRVSGFGPARVGIYVVPAALTGIAIGALAANSNTASQGTGQVSTSASPVAFPNVFANVSDSGQWVEYLRVPLFFGPNAPLPAGSYRVVVITTKPGPLPPVATGGLQDVLTEVGPSAAIDITVR